MKCIQCDSKDLVKNVRVVDRSNDNIKRELSIETHEDPSAWIFKGAIESKVYAHVCAD